MVITSLDNDKVKNYIKLKNRKYRKKTKMFIAEGLHVVLEAYKAGYVVEVILEQDEVIPFDVPVVYVTREIITKISDLESPPNVLALCKMKEESEVAGNKILMLDGVQDPGNLGTIIRSSLAFGVDTLVLSPETCDLYNSKVIRSTQGMVFGLNIVTSPLIDVIKDLKKMGYPIYGTKVEYGRDVRDLTDRDKEKYVLIVGNEGSGVHDDVLDECDSYLYIDMDEKVESLNVGVAASILIYELNR